MSRWIAILSLLAAFACVNLPGRGDDGALVSVGQPAIYARERFIGDRFEDLQWLRDQLGKEQLGQYEQGLQGASSTVTRDQLALGVKVLLDRLAGVRAATDEEPKSGGGDSGDGDGSDGDDNASDAGNDEGTETGDPTAVALDDLLTARALREGDLPRQLLERVAATGPTPSPRDRLVDRLAFRDEVRTAIRQRALDDTHDLLGTTLYELQFDISLAAGCDTGAAYIVAMGLRMPGDTAQNEHQVADIARAMEREALQSIHALRVRARQGTITSSALPSLVAATRRASLLASYRTVKLLWEACRLEPSPGPASLSESWKHVEDEVSAIPDGVTLEQYLIHPESEVDGLAEAIDRFRREMVAALDGVYRAESEDREPLPDTPALDESSDQMARFAWSPDQVSFDEGLRSRSEDARNAWARALTDLAAGKRLRQDGLEEVRRSLLSPPVEDRTLLANSLSLFEAMRYAVASELLVIEPASEVDPTADHHQAFVRAKEGPLPILADVVRDLPKVPRVINVSPSEQAELLSATAQSEIRRALGIAASGILNAKVAAGVEFQRLTEELRRYDMIARNPLLVGFVRANGLEPSGRGQPIDASGQSHQAGTSFGWILGPRLETSTSGTAKLRYRQDHRHHSVTATLVVPSYLSSIELDVSAWMLTRDGSMRPARCLLDEPSSEGGLTRHTMQIHLPTDPSAVVQGLLFSKDPALLYPRITLPTEEPDPGRAHWRCQAGEPASLLIRGHNIWRNPEVYVGGQQADRVHILPDLDGLAADFTAIAAPPGQTSDPVLCDLIVSTSRGTDVHRQVIEVLPSKGTVLPKVPRAKLVEAFVVHPTSGGKVPLDLSFTLDPPLPPSWSSLSLRVRPEGGSAAYFDQDPLLAAHFTLGTEGKSLRLRGVQVEAKEPVEWLSLDSWFRTSPLADPTRLTPGSVRLLVLRTPFGYAVAGGKKVEVVYDSTKKTWMIADKQVVVLEPGTQATPDFEQWKLAAPELATPGGAKVSLQLGKDTLQATVTLLGASTAPRFELRLPSGVALSALGDKEEGPATVPSNLATKLGPVELTLQGVEFAKEL